MRIVHILSRTAHGPISFSDLVTGGRGVTGSEQTMLLLARAQALRGNEVVCYLPTRQPGVQEGVELIDIDSTWPRLRRIDSADVVISWLSADGLRNVPSRAVRICNLQINDWLLCAPRHESYTDVYVLCSEAHRSHMLKQHNAPVDQSKCVIIPNGIDCTRYRVAPKRRRKCVYMSSPDRGLHWVLYLWRQIRYEFPDAELHVFYEIGKLAKDALFFDNEVGQRMRYIVGAVERLASHGVFVHGAVAPANLFLELADSDLLLYPCDPANKFTEGQGMAILDAMASGVVPVLTDADALGELYSSSGAVMVSRTETAEWVDHYLEAVLSIMKDDPDVERRRHEVFRFARQYDWSQILPRWEALIEQQRQLKS